MTIRTGFASRARFMALIAAVVLWAGKNGNISKVVTIMACGIVGLIWLALATTGAGARLGEWAVNLLVG